MKLGIFKDQDIRCFETRVSRLIQDEKGSRVSPIRSLRNMPNVDNVTFQHGKRKGQLKPFKHKDFQ